MAIQFILTLSYVSIFLKLHLDGFEHVPYAWLHWIGTGPLILFYGVEVVTEIFKLVRNKI